MAEPVQQFNRESIGRISDAVRFVESMPGGRPHDGRGGSVPSARVLRWARTTTSYEHPTYPDAGPVYVVEFGDATTSPDPVYPGCTFEGGFEPYASGWKEIAIDPSGATWAEGSIVRVERHEGQWYIRPAAAASTPSVYLTDFTRILASGSGSPGANQITRARAGAIYFQEAWGDPAEAGVEVLTDSANDSDDPSLRITTDGCYRLAVGFAGDDVTTFAIEDYYTTYDTSTVSSHAHTYKFFDTWHHAKAILYVSRRASGGSWDGSWIMYGASNREVFGGSGSYLGGGSTALTGGSWSYGTMRCFGMERFNFDAGDELIFRLFYFDYSPIADTALTFEIANFNVEIARLSDQVTPETYALP